MEKRKWSGKVMIHQRDNCPFVGQLIQNAIDYYNDNEGWPHCVMTYTDVSGTKWVCFYELLKSGTIKVSIWIENP